MVGFKWNSTLLYVLNFHAIDMNCLILTISTNYYRLLMHNVRLLIFVNHELDEQGVTGWVVPLIGFLGQC